MSRTSLPLVLLFGPSGAGKSTLCAALSRELGWLRVETDPYSGNQGPEAGRVLACVRRALASGPRFDELVTEVRALAGTSHRGVVVSFVSMDSPRIDDIRALEALGAHTVYLLGTEEECRRAFLEREARTGRRLPMTHWHRHNALVYDHCRQAAYQPYVIHAFSGGVHRPVLELVAELQLLLERRDPTP